MSHWNLGGGGHYLELDLWFLSLIKPEERNPSLHSAFHMRWGKVWGGERQKKKGEKLLESCYLTTELGGWLQCLGQDSSLVVSMQIYPLMNIYDIYESIYQPEVPAQTKPPDCFRNPSKSLLLKFRAVAHFNSGPWMLKTELRLIAGSPNPIASPHAPSHNPILSQLQWTGARFLSAWGWEPAHVNTSRRI